MSCDSSLVAGAESLERFTADSSQVQPEGVSSRFLPLLLAGPPSRGEVLRWRAPRRPSQKRLGLGQVARSPVCGRGRAPDATAGTRS